MFDALVCSDCCATCVAALTSLAMGITVSVLLGAVVQVMWTMLCWNLVDIWVWYDFVLVPARTSEPSFSPRWSRRVFFTLKGDMMHVLGNVIILALVGVPEQRLGTRRYGMVYIIGLLGVRWAGCCSRPRAPLR